MLTKFKIDAFVCVCACIFIMLKHNFLSLLPPLHLQDTATSVTCLQACNPVFCKIELISDGGEREGGVRTLSPLAHLNTHSVLVGERERQRSYYSELVGFLTLILMHPWHGQKVTFNEVQFRE